MKERKEVQEIDTPWRQRTVLRTNGTTFVIMPPSFYDPYIAYGH